MASRTAPVAALAAALACVPASTAGAEESEIGELRRLVEELARENREMRSTIEELRSEVRETRAEVLSTRDEVPEERPLPPVAAAPAEAPPAAPGQGALLSRQVGRASFQLLDVSLDVLTAAGGSTVGGENLDLLQAGEHDPRQRGFTFQQAELSLMGAVDPYLGAEAHLIYFLDAEGESRFEIEEAFATSRMLPFGAERLGFQLEAGQFFSEFGRINPQHPHQWDWQDQPLLNSRFFGGDGMRQTGVQLSWLSPLPWFSELRVGMQNCGGETMVSFCANDEVFEERPIGGRPFGEPRVTGLEDFTWLARWANGFDVSDTVSAQLGLSSAFGQNATGGSGFTSIAGGDVVVKWRPLASDRGWPFLVFQAEAMGRWYDAASFTGCPEGEDPCADPVFAPGGAIEDWGLYGQLLWGFARNWAAGIRGEYASGSGAGIGFEEDPLSGDLLVVKTPRSQDPFRGDRTRISPLLVFQATEFSRLRLQYNYDHALFLSGNEAHSIWAGLEILFGAHPAHSY